MGKILRGDFSMRPRPLVMAELERRLDDFYRRNPLKRRHLEVLFQEADKEERWALFMSRPRRLSEKEAFESTGKRSNNLVSMPLILRPPECSGARLRRKRT